MKPRKLQIMCSLVIIDSQLCTPKNMLNYCNVVQCIGCTDCLYVPFIWLQPAANAGRLKGITSVHLNSNPSVSDPYSIEVRPTLAATVQQH